MGNGGSESVICRVGIMCEGNFWQNSELVEDENSNLERNLRNY